MPRTEEANQRIREEQRAKILEAAWQVYVRKGRALTMADVAETAQVSYGLAYHYFASKEAILYTLVEQSLHNLEVAFQRFMAGSGTPGERLDFLLSRLVESRREHPEYSQLFSQVMSDEQAPPELLERALKTGQLFQDTLKQLIVEGQATGEVAPDNPDQLVTAVLAYLDGLTRLSMSDSERLRQYFPDAQIFLRMLKQNSGMSIKKRSKGRRDEP